MSLIEEFKKLKKDGYSLTKIGFNWNNLVMIILIFQKGLERIELECKEWTTDLAEYIKSNFLGFDNLPFSNIEAGVIHISGWSFSKIKITKFEKELFSRQVKTKMTFQINLDQVEENLIFEQVDTRGELKLKIKDQQHFVGYINYIHCIDPPFSDYSVYCEGISSILEVFQMSADMYAQKGNSFDFFSFFLDFFEIDYVYDAVEDQNEVNREFLIIIPINGLNISKDIRIGKCLINSKFEEPTNLQKESPFFNFNAYAKMKFKSNSFYNTLKIGIANITNAINLINFRNRLPSYFESYDYLTQNSLLELSNLVFIKDLLKNSEIIIHLPFFQPLPLERDSYINNYFRPILGVGNVYVDPEKKFEIKEEKITMALYYLFSAEQKVNRNRRAALLDLWVSFDYVISALSPKIHKQFRPSEMREIKYYCSKFIENQKTEHPEKYYKRKERYSTIQQRLNELIGSNFNQPSIKKRLDTLFEIYNLKFSENEERLYKTARKKRNRIIHGSEVIEISKEEYNILSKVVYFILKKELFKKTELHIRPDIRLSNPLAILCIRTLMDIVCDSLIEIYPSNTNFKGIKRDMNKLTSLGMPKPAELSVIKNVDIKIPKKFDDILELIINQLVLELPNNESIKKCVKFLNHSILVYDVDKQIKSILDLLVKGLKEEYPDNELIKKAQSQIDQLNRLGMVSFNLENVFKGFERHKRFEKIKKR